MAYSISTYELPTLRNYQQALRHFESIKPIKSRDYYSVGIRPIGNRRQVHKNIHQLFNGDIACQLYSTDCVVYHQDDSITVDFGGWTTQSTAAFINAISPWTAYLNGYVSTGKGTFKVPREGLKILPDGTPVNPVQEYRTLLDKKKAAETRKKLKPFLSWVKAVETFGGDLDADILVSFDVGELLRRPGDVEVYNSIAIEYFGMRYGMDALMRDAYKFSKALIQVPVPLGTERRPTQWD